MAIASVASKTLVERLRLEMFQAAHSVGSVFGSAYDFKFHGEIIEHGFVNYRADRVPLCQVVQGKKLKTPKALMEIGVLSASRIFRESFAGDALAGWVTHGASVRTRDALEEIFKMIARNAEHLMVACKTYDCPITGTLRYDLYIETKNFEDKDKSRIFLTIRDFDLKKVKATSINPFA